MKFTYEGTIGKPRKPANEGQSKTRGMGTGSAGINAKVDGPLNYHKKLKIGLLGKKKEESHLV